MYIYILYIYIYILYIYIYVYCIYIYVYIVYIYRYKSIVFMAFINQSDKIGAAACTTDMAPFFVTEVSRLKSPGTFYRAASMAVVCYLWNCYINGLVYPLVN